MVVRFSSVTSWLVVLASFLLSGCEHRYSKDVSACEQVVDPNLLLGRSFVMPEYVSRAIEATGGRQAWMRTKRLSMGYRVKFYRSDESFYLTEQQCEIYPWSNCIRISAEEPQGRLVSEFSNGVFRVLQGSERVDAPLSTMFDVHFAEAILNITTAPVRLLDLRALPFTKLSDPVKKEGRWYYPIETYHLGCEPNDMRGESYVMRTQLKAVFYLNKDSYLAELVWFPTKRDPKLLLAEAGIAMRGYEYRQVETNGVWLPGKVEMFATDASGAHKRRLAVIDFD